MPRHRCCFSAHQPQGRRWVWCGYPPVSVLSGTGDGFGTDWVNTTCHCHHKDESFKSEVTSLWWSGARNHLFKLILTTTWPSPTEHPYPDRQTQWVLSKASEVMPVTPLQGTCCRSRTQRSALNLHTRNRASHRAPPPSLPAPWLWHTLGTQVVPEKVEGCKTEGGKKKRRLN